MAFADALAIVDGFRRRGIIKDYAVIGAVAAAEHLVLLYLLAFREKDRIRVRYLLQDLDQELLKNLVERFDDGENTLSRRLQELRGTSIPREGEVASPSSTDELQA